MYFKRDGLARQRMVEVEQNCIATVIIANLHHCTRVLTLPIWCGELHHIACAVRFMWVAQLHEQLARNPLHHVRLALAKCGTCRQFKGLTSALVKPQQALLHRWRQFARAQRQRCGLTREGVDDVARRPGQAVMQGEEGAGVNLGNKWGLRTLDNHLPIVENLRRRRRLAVLSPHMSIKNLPADARPREKLLARGPGALSDAELLALLLRTGIAGKGVLQMADELLHLKTNSAGEAGFDGIAGLLQASGDDLKRVKGLGPAKRAELMAVLELARRAMAQQLKERTVFATPGAVKEYLKLQLSAKTQEVFAVLFLDVKSRMIALEELFQGTLTHTSVYPREVVLRALHHQAASVVLAHNHPSGSAAPSAADESLTRVLKAALALIDIPVMDHMIVGTGEVFSFAEKGLL